MAVVDSELLIAAHLKSGITDLLPSRKSRRSALGLNSTEVANLSGLSFLDQSVSQNLAPRHSHHM